MGEHDNPLLPAASRFPIGVPPDEHNGTACLSPLGERAFLLRYAEPLQLGKHGKTGATAPTTTGGDGHNGNNEDQSLPDYEP